MDISLKMKEFGILNISAEPVPETKEVIMEAIDALEKISLDFEKLAKIAEKYRKNPSN